MKVISIWQPFASLLVHGHKVVETRTWKAPCSLIGQCVGIASTKIIRPEQRSVFDDPIFAGCYIETDLPSLDKMPNGYLVGSVILHSCDLMTEEDLDDVSTCEYSFGVWEEGRYAWRVRAPVAFERPIPVSGAQGIWELDDEIIRSAQILERET